MWGPGVIEKKKGIFTQEIKARVSRGSLSLSLSLLEAPNHAGARINAFLSRRSECLSRRGTLLLFPPARLFVSACVYYAELFVVIFAAEHFFASDRSSAKRGRDPRKEKKKCALTRRKTFIVVVAILLLLARFS